MWAFLASALAAIPSAATSTFSLIAFALAIAAYVFIVWRVVRNKNLLQHLQKLPPKDRLGALETELGGVRLAAGLSPEQWLRSKMHKYYLLAFLATCGVVGVTSTLAIMNRSPVPGTTYINSSTVFQNQVQQIVGQSVIDPELKQKIEHAIESGAKRDFQTAVNLYEQIPENMRVPAVWNNLGVAYLGLGDQPRARAAFEKARERNPNDDAANANLSHLNKVAAFTPAAPQDASSQPKPAEGRPVRAETQAKQPDINLLAPDQGGQLLAAPNETWAKAITGSDTDEVQVRPGEEAVYAFKDEKLATFAKFSILVDSSYGGNVKDLELLVGDESPVGSFRSIGKFTAQNLRLIKSPYQEFTFPETTAKYLKIKVLSNYGGSPMGSTFLKQIRLIGRPAT